MMRMMKQLTKLLRKNLRCYRRSAVFFTLVCMLGSASFAQSPAMARAAADSWWLTMEQGKRFFRNGEYGEALRSFEAAREQRKNKYARLERDFITLLSIHTVRKLKDDLGLVEMYIQKEYRTAAAGALEELYYRIPRERLDNSASRALEELRRLKEYPEAEYWIGETYRAEGEYAIALNQYNKAYDNRSLLEIPEFGIEILYKIAELHRLRGEDTDMEQKLTDILKTDESWNAESFARSAMTTSAANNGLDRFLVLYRNNNQKMEKAHRFLGFFYYASGRHNRAAEHLLFSFLIQNTLIIDELKEERYDYRFTGLEALFSDIAASTRQTRQKLENYMADSEYYKVLYHLANSMYADGKAARAREIWTFLREHGAGEWQGRSARQLARPEIEPVAASQQTAQP